MCNVIHVKVTKISNLKTHDMPAAQNNQTKMRLWLDGTASWWKER